MILKVGLGRRPGLAKVYLEDPKTYEPCVVRRPSGGLLQAIGFRVYVGVCGLGYKGLGFRV